MSSTLATTLLKTIYFRRHFDPYTEEEYNSIHGKQRSPQNQLH